MKGCVNFQKTRSCAKLVFLEKPRKSWDCFLNFFLISRTMTALVRRFPRRTRISKAPVFAHFREKVKATRNIPFSQSSSKRDRDTRAWDSRSSAERTVLKEAWESTSRPYFLMVRPWASLTKVIKNKKKRHFV